jgi:DNA-directed RNA polymerase subunit K/omega
MGDVKIICQACGYSRQEGIVSERVALLEKKLARAIQALNRASEVTYYEKPNFEDGTFEPTYDKVIEEALKEIEEMK